MDHYKILHIRTIFNWNQSRKLNKFIILFCNIFKGKIFRDIKIRFFKGI